MPITEKDKELRGIIEKNLVGMYSYKAYDTMQMLSVCEENYQYVKNIYNNVRYKFSTAQILCKSYLPEKAKELFALFSASDEAIVRSIAVNVAKTHGIDLTEFFAEMDRKSKKMLENPESEIAFVKKYAEKYRVDVSDNGLFAVIYNPFCQNPLSEDSIFVAYEEDEYTVCFSFQHVHVQYPEDAENWIEEVMSEERLPIEFFKDGRRVMGGDIKATALRKLTYESLKVYFRNEELCGLADSFKIRSWSGEKNLDAEFVCIDGKIMIKVIG